MPCLGLLWVTGTILWNNHLKYFDIRVLLKRDLNVPSLLALYMLQINSNDFKSPHHTTIYHVEPDLILQYTPPSFSKRGANTK